MSKQPAQLGAHKILWIFAGEIDGAILEAGDLTITIAENLCQAGSYLEAEDFAAVVVTVACGDMNADAVFERIHAGGGQAPVIVHSPEATVADAVRWTKLGAWQVAGNGSEALDAVRGVIGGLQIRTLANALGSKCPPLWRQFMIGQSQKIHHIAEVVRLVAPRRCTVLIAGETGTGKEVIARCIHAASNRAQFDMVAVNCSALPENLLEAELFGHVKGAFTGATGTRVGRFEQAHRGSLFLDEIGDLPMPLQAKLLRVLQEREFQRLGSSETVKVDVRVIAASNVNLPEKVKRGSFREDLYYRLNVVPIEAPPLRERLTDIPLLVKHFIERLCRDEDIPLKHVSDAVYHRLAQHDWPGNVRQLENAVEMAIVLSGERSILYPSDFPLPSRGLHDRERMTAASPFVAVPDDGLDFEKIVGGIELNILEQALRKTGGNKKMAAQMLRLKRTTLAAKLKSLSETVGAA